MELYIPTVERHMLTWQNHWEYFVSNNYPFCIMYSTKSVATASSTDDQCQLEGCTRPKLQEGARIHDYCSMEHAKKDEPNRQGMHG